MSDVAIQVSGLWKQYRIGKRERYKTFRETVVQIVTGPFRRLKRAVVKDDSSCFWALQDVNFEVNQGEVVGIIGRNGAGKSTLLKVLSRITEPTQGRVEITGRVGSLLEVGTGFHPELTGRENIYLNGAILGMTRAEINRKFDAIVEFSEIERFLDTQVKFYSSGMYMRLAFAVAAHLEPEILVVDEVLAVGDAGFQKKCLGKMGEVAQQGRTVLFVSHNMTAVNALCSRAIWLNQGKVIKNGPTAEIVGAYLQSADRIQSVRVWDDPKTAPGNEVAKMRSIRIQAADGNEESVITVDTPIRLSFEYDNYVEGALLNLSIELYTIGGVCVFNTFPLPQKMKAGRVRSEFVIPGGLLNDGMHVLKLLIVRDEGNVQLWLDDAAQFEVNDVRREVSWHGKWLGATRPRFEWKTGPAVPA